MSFYDYKHEGRRFTADAAAMKDAVFVTAQPTNVPLHGMLIPNADVPTVAAELLKVAGQESIIIPKAYEEVEQLGDEITCGSGPEAAHASMAMNPNWLRKGAANMIALAEYIESAAAEKAEAEAAEKKLQERRDAVAREITQNNDGLAVSGYASLNWYTQKAVDRIIELATILEDGASRD